MKVLASVSTGFCVLSTAALLFALDLFFWHVLRLGFEAVTGFGALAMMLGSTFAVLGLVFAVVGLRKHGRTAFRVALCLWGGALVLTFGSLMLK